MSGDEASPASPVMCRASASRARIEFRDDAVRDDDEMVSEIRLDDVAEFAQRRVPCVLFEFGGKGTALEVTQVAALIRAVRVARVLLRQAVEVRGSIEQLFPQ